MSVRKKDIFRQQRLRLFLPRTLSQETSRGVALLTNQERKERRSRNSQKTGGQKKTAG